MWFTTINFRKLCSARTSFFILSKILGHVGTWNKLLFSLLYVRIYMTDHEFKVTFSIKKIGGNSCLEFQNRSLNGKLTPVKVTRHTMPQIGRKNFNLTGFKCTNDYILTEKVSWFPVTGVKNLGKTTQTVNLLKTLNWNSRTNKNSE
jgi:hypothetical protein